MMSQVIVPPQTLREAIENALDLNDPDWTGREVVTDAIKAHVDEFIRQKLNPIMLSTDKAKVLAAMELQELLGISPVGGDGFCSKKDSCL